jgi:adenosylcobinamide amidohydrolase
MAAASGKQHPGAVAIFITKFFYTETPEYFNNTFCQKSNLSGAMAALVLTMCFTSDTAVLTKRFLLSGIGWLCIPWQCAK